MISVIIPTYNSEKYIKEALDSVIYQTYKNIEIIVVDDGSTDQTYEILQPYIDRNGIKYVYQENSGPALARNQGITNATGDFVAFLDADDIWLPHFLEKLYERLYYNNDIGFVYCDNYYVDEQKKYIENYIRETRKYSGNICTNLLCEHFILTPSVLIRKKCFDVIGLFDESLRVGEDYEFFLRLAFAYNADFVDEKLWERRVLKNSLSRQDFVIDATNDLSTLKRFIKQHLDLYINNKKTIDDRLSYYHFSFGYNCLETGKNIMALQQFIFSLYYKITVKTFKNILYCMFPLNIRQLIKSIR
jgi:glycosyltransferase involved in cell wall biosynthesis